MNELNSLHDRMTGLPSRGYLLQNLDGILGHNGQIVFMIADIDSCKTFNYSSGYIKGDEEIIKVGREIRKLVGKNPIVCRWGGDEFGVIFYESSLESAREIAEKIRAQRPPLEVKIDDRSFRTFTLSIGLAHFPDQSYNASSLIEGAELALSKAKNGGQLPNGTPFPGRNRVVAIGDFLDEPSVDSIN